MSLPAIYRSGPTPPLFTNSDGSIAVAGYTIPTGPAQHDDVARLVAGDPKAAYLVVARYQGNPGVIEEWPAFAAGTGLEGGS